MFVAMMLRKKGKKKKSDRESGEIWAWALVSLHSLAVSPSSTVRPSPFSAFLVSVPWHPSIAAWLQSKSQHDAIATYVLAASYRPF